MQGEINFPAIFVTVQPAPAAIYVIYHRKVLRLAAKGYTFDPTSILKSLFSLKSLIFFLQNSIHKPDLFARITYNIRLCTHWLTLEYRNPFPVFSLLLRLSLSRISRIIFNNKLFHSLKFHCTCNAGFLD